MRQVPAGARRWAPLAWRLLVAPDLWGVALAQVFRLSRKDWWRRSPYLPVPESRYLRFRLETAYGSVRPPETSDPASDVIDYLRWCKNWRKKQ